MKDRREILALQNNKCAWCRANLRRAKIHTDHIVPLALGGRNGRQNIQFLCAPCNLSKGAKDPVAFAQECGRLI